VLILGVNSDQADVSAALLADGQLVAAVEEERFSRVKHCTGFPTEAIRQCLAVAGIAGREVDRVAVCGNPRSHLLRRIGLTFVTRPAPAQALRRAGGAARDTSLERQLAHALATSTRALPPIHRIEHHPAHLASAFHVSPFEEAAICAADGIGDLVSTSLGHGRGDKLRVIGRRFSPHSLGLLYTSVTQYLGFRSHGDEYKVMGLAAFGEPNYVEELARVLKVRPDGRYWLDRSFFLPARELLAVPSSDGRPRPRRLFSPRLEQLLGPARQPKEPLAARHRDVARSLQVVFEEAALRVLRSLAARTGAPHLCVAGGCFMNSALNGRIEGETPFDRVFIQPAAGDSGTALGAAYWLWCQQLGRRREFVMRHAYTGTAHGQPAIQAAIGSRREALHGFDVTTHSSVAELCNAVAAAIAGGNVVGWFQGRMEWGSRALGNRSVLADPRDAAMRDLINARIKRRETFRPFAPSMLESSMADFFHDGGADPFMLKVRQVRPEKRARIPAVVHVDGSSRPHTVTTDANPRFFELLQAFERVSGVPVLLNTSLNENEPIVESPEQALDCFLRTGMDLAVLGDTVIRRPTAVHQARQHIEPRQ
jgi:carbamoyltransferase